MDTRKIDKLFNQVTKGKNIFEGAILIENSSGDFSYSKGYERDIDTLMLMASITKLFTTTCILALMEEGRISLSDKISKYFDDEILKGLHVYKGREYSFDLTVENLLFQTSGLSDFYLDGAGSILKRVFIGDFSYTFEEELAWGKSMNPRFAPGAKGKAYYSDINFDLLGKIIEEINGSTLQEAYEKYIFQPLNLQNTYLAREASDFVPHTYYKSERIERATFIRSCYASGGGVTTARELMIFLKAFWSGKLFSKEVFKRIEAHNPLQMSYYPIHYSGGYMRIEAGYPFGKKDTLVGHSGSTGAFAFYCPNKDLFFVGDIPQIASPSICVRLAMRAALASRK